MALTADQLNTIYQNVLFRNVDQGGIQFFANRSDISDAQVRQQIELSSEASTFVSPIVRLYQEVLGRVPDQGGLRFFQAQLRGGTSLDNIAQQLLSSSEFTAKTTATSGVVDATDLSNTNQLVTDAFASILGRAPAQSEFAFFQGRTPAQILAGVAGSPEAQQANASGVVTFLDSVAQGTYPTGSLNGQTGGTNGGTNAGQTFTLSQNIDNLTGTGAADTFIGDNTGANPSVQPADTINGGGGIDTLKLFLNGGTTSLNATAVEILDIQSQTGAVFNAQNVVGATTIISDNSAAGLAVTNVQNNVAVQALNTTSGFAVTFAADKLGSTTATAALKVTGSGNAATNTAEVITLTTAGGDKFSTVTVDAVGTDSVVINNIDATGGATTAFKTLTVTDTGKVAIQGTLANLTTVDASANTGGVTVNLGANTKDVSFTGGSGDDRVYFAAGAFTSADKAVGGTGTDTLVVGDATLTGVAPDTLATSINASTGFEILGTTATTAVTIDASKFSNFTGFELSSPIGAIGAATDSLTITGLKNSGQSITLEHSVTNAVTGTVGTDSGNDSITVNVTDNLNATSTITVGTNLDLRTFEKVALNVSDNFTVTTETDVGPNGVVTLTGKGDVNLGTLKSIAGDVTAQNLTLDASGLTGKLTVVTGAGNDVITVNTKGSVITAGAGADTVNLGSGQDTVKVAVGDSGTVVTANNITGLDTYNNFTAGAGGDVIDFTGAVTYQKLTTIQASNVAAAGDLKAAADLAGSYLSANLKATAFDFGGSTYVLENDSNGGNPAAYDATKEVLVKVVGATAAQFDATNIA